MSEIKVNKISPRAACGTVQLGDSGDTITIPAGATITNAGTATGFGATGSVNWQTSSIKTTTFTAANGEGYFVDTTSGAVTANLPAGTAGAIVGFKDYAKTFDSTNKLTLVQNGSDKVGGSTINPEVTTAGIAITLVFVDSTQGWLVTDDGLQSEAATAQFISASGGTETTSGNFKIHTFTSPGTFTVSCAGNSGGSNTVDYLVVAGGGGGGKTGGGGGAGGARFFASPDITSYPASPNNGPTALPVTATGYPVTVGGGGAGNANPGCQGGDGSVSTFAGTTTITSTGGGGAGGPGPGGTTDNGRAGGSGGGVGRDGGPSASVGAGNTPSVSPPQGTNGAPGGPPNGGDGGGGGGGATVAGSSNGPSGAGAGGTGATSSITGSAVTRAGGGGGGATPAPATKGAAGSGGGGTGAGCGPSGLATNATDNTGGGGGGSSGGPGIPITQGGNGGSGIVIIRYKFQ